MKQKMVTEDFSLSTEDVRAVKNSTIQEKKKARAVRISNVLSHDTQQQSARTSPCSIVAIEAVDGVRNVPLRP